jgi:hypothetical protein
MCLWFSGGRARKLRISQDKKKHPRKFALIIVTITANICQHSGALSISTSNVLASSSMPLKEKVFPIKIFHYSF